MTLTAALVLTALFMSSCSQGGGEAGKEYIAEIDRQIADLDKRIEETIHQNDLRAAGGEPIVDTGPLRKQRDDLNLKKMEYQANHH
jgi:hypothetical protein